MDDASSPDIDQIIDSLREAKLIAPIPKERIQQLIPHFNIVSLEPDQVLFNQGDSADFLYILYAGELASVLVKATGVEVIVGSILPVETVGELSAFSSNPRSLTIKAVTQAKLICMPNSLFKELCNEYPALLSEISRLVIERSLKTIKMLDQEKRAGQLSLILPLIESIPVAILRNKFKEHTNHSDIVFVSTQETTSEQLQNLISQSEKENRSIVVFMDTWNKEIFTAIWQKLTHLYVAFVDGDHIYAKHSNKEILDIIKHYPRLQLELLLFHQDNVRQVVNTIRYLQQANFTLHHHLRLNNAADFQRVIRFMTGKAFVLVLGGGGAKGLSHLGALKGIVENNIPIDAIGGTSVGSGVAAAYAASLNLNNAEKMIYAFKEAGFKSIAPSHLTWPVISLFDSNPLTDLLIQTFESVCIEDLWIPFFAVSSDLSEQREFVHRTGLLWEAVRSSGSIPGMYPPVAYHGHIFVDGGLLNNLPVDVMRDLIGPGHTIIASSLSRNDNPTEDYDFPVTLPLVKTLLSRMHMTTSSYRFPPFFQTFLDSLLLGSSVLEKKHSSAADILIRPDLSGFAALAANKGMDQKLVAVGFNEAIRSITQYFDVHPDKRLH